EKSPSVAGLQWERARTTNNLAAVLEQTQGVEQAIPVYREALAGFKRLSDDFPSVPDYQSERAVASFNLGGALIREADYKLRTKEGTAAEKLHNEAFERLDEAVAIYRNLIQPDRFPDRPDYREKFALAGLKQGILRDKTGHPEQGEAAFR